MKNHESAGSNIVGTYELLENVLRFLPDKDILLAQSVSQEFKYVIETSIAIRRQLHFIASGDDYKPFHPFLPCSFPEATIKPLGHYVLEPLEPRRGGKHYHWYAAQLMTDDHGLSLGRMVDVLRAQSLEAGVSKRVKMVFVGILSSMKGWKEAQEADEERAWPYTEYPFEEPW